jgi:hypothetical protein
MAQSTLGGLSAGLRSHLGEDHDERVIELVEALYFGGILPPVRFVGERKGSLSVLIDDKTVEARDRTILEGYHAAVSDVGQSLEDPWPSTVDAASGRNHSIIQAPAITSPCTCRTSICFGPLA